MNQNQDDYNCLTCHIVGLNPITKKELIDKYLRLASNDGKVINVSMPITPVEVIEVISEVEEEIEEVVEEPIKDIIKDKVFVKKESDIPRRYGKEKITADILAQGGNAKGDGGYYFVNIEGANA